MCPPPLYVLSLCFSSPPLVPPTSRPLHLQFQPSVQLVGRDAQETGRGSAGERQVQRPHQSDSALREEEEQHLAAVTQRQEQSLRLSQRGVSITSGKKHVEKHLRQT